MQLTDVPTPALLLDHGRLVKNTAAMAARAAAAGVRLRPHLKTAKCIQVARLATLGHFGGVTVSTLAEAEYFLGHGITDITYAVCMVPAKLAHAAALVLRGARLTLLTDSPDTASALDARAAALGAQFPVLIEIDSGEHRTGVAWDSAALLDIAHVLDRAQALTLQGVLTHAGHAYVCDSVAAIAEVAEHERLAVVNAAGRIRDAGLECATVSVGSTPTAVHARSLDGVTEIRPGVYVFFDLAQLGLGSCALDDLALSVLATVISHQPAHNRLIIDAGGLALSKDVSASAKLPGAGYGWLVDIQTGQRIGDLHVAVADQEHGYVEGTSIPYDILPVGAKVRVLPNHACMTAAQYQRYTVVENDRVVDRWDRINGW